MALAEARAAWQRTASRCFVQEDAKRAPKLACCSSLPPSIQEAELRPSGSAGGQETPPTVYVLSHPEPLYGNLSPKTCWWLHLQPSYGDQNILKDAKVTMMEGADEASCLKESSQDFSSSEAGFVVVDHSAEAVFSSQVIAKEGNTGASYDCYCYDPRKSDGEVNCRKKDDDGFEAFLSNNVKYFDLEFSCIGSERSGPWWRTADAEELAVLVTQRSNILMENCDLPLPHNPCKKAAPAIHQNLVHPPSNLSSQLTGSTSDQDSYQKRGLSFKSGYGVKGVKTDEDTAQLLEALRHSQTRARESEKIAKEACAEKEHLIKLLLRQASHLFAYKQWLHILQLENRLASASENETQKASSVMAPGKSLRRTKINSRRIESGGDVISKYAVVFALGLGLVGVGLMLGWGMARMLLPPCRVGL